ncbi:MAG: M15 family metallopeptidase [Clostridia bacterium]|nr:M15 family metallopeptidase [Clostridia bacterium]
MAPVPEDEYLLLVNREHPIGRGNAPEDLTELSGTRADGRPTQTMRKCAAMALNAMFLELDRLGYLDRTSPDGLTFSVTSGYRSYEYQASLFETYKSQYMAGGMTEEQAIARVSRTTARPGESEHQTGLCVDMHDRLCATTEFEHSPVFAWLSENAWKFGFILRYPKGKEEITGYSYEPWHYRYVGRFHAERIHRAGLCLEEYVS